VENREDREKRGETDDVVSRDPRGRWQKGAKPGPGRPRKPAIVAPASAAAMQEVGVLDADQLVMRAMALKELHEAWRVLLDHHEERDLVALVDDCRRRGEYVPVFVREALGLLA